MLPSMGYFSGIPCVFYTDEDCVRPHCHFRHLEPKAGGVKPTNITTIRREHNSYGSQSCDSKETQKYWSLAQISMVAKLVENAVDKALRNDVRKDNVPPRDTLVRNTIDKLLADPEALKMVHRKSNRQVQLPSYNPTPISILTHKHIPVSSVPEKPYISIAKPSMLTSCSPGKTASHLIPNVKPDASNSPLTHTPENTTTKLESQTTQVNLESNLEDLQVHPEHSLPEGFHVNQSEHKVPAGFEPTSTIMPCSILLEKLTKSEVKKYSKSVKNSSKTSKDACREAKSPDPSNQGGIPSHPMLETKLLKNIWSKSDHVKAENGSRLESLASCEPPTKKKKFVGFTNKNINLRVSSTEDPFSRWMNNKKIRQILKKDDCRDSKPHQEKSLTTSELQIPQNEDQEELPEPKISKRVAHKIDQHRPVPIIADQVKISSALRHHFCSAFFDELQKKMEPELAKRKAAEEELQVAKNSKLTKTYKNNCTLMIMKFRKGNFDCSRQVKPELTPASCPDFTYGWSLYRAFSSYILGEDELRENGFPMALQGKVNCAYVDKACRKYSVQQPEKISQKVCALCSKEFEVDMNCMPMTSNDCFYHWGKLRKVQYKGQVVKKFTCCGGSVDSSPCESSVYHVWSETNEDCMDNFVETSKLPSHMKDDEAGIYALDCEMCYTTKGLELARLTVLNLNGRVVFDEVVSLENPVLNYCTRFSGIDADKMSAATHTFDDVRRWILEHFYDKTILIGHSLENDFKALKLIHRRVVDTSVTFPHKFGPPNKMSLKHLAAVVLEINIQENADGHDSKEDASTCLQLMMKKIQEDSKARKPRVIIGYDGTKK